MRENLGDKFNLKTYHFGGVQLKNGVIKMVFVVNQRKKLYSTQRNKSNTLNILIS